MIARHRPGRVVPVLPRWPKLGWTGWGSSSLPMVCLLVLLALGGALFCQPTIVEGASMSPTLHTGQVVWTDRAHYWRNPPQVGEVVLFRHDGATYIKRVYGLPGQTLYWIGDQSELMRPIRANYAAEMRQRWPRAGGPILSRVPEDHIFVLGDNTLNSVDSRHFGAIPISELIGRVRMSADTRRLVALEYSPVPLPPHHRHRASAHRSVARLARSDR